MQTNPNWMRDLNRHPLKLRTFNKLCEAEAAFAKLKTIKPIFSGAKSKWQTVDNRFVIRAAIEHVCSSHHKTVEVMYGNSRKYEKVHARFDDAVNAYLFAQPRRICDDEGMMLHLWNALHNAAFELASYWKVQTPFNATDTSGHSAPGGSRQTVSAHASRRDHIMRARAALYMHDKKRDVALAPWRMVDTSHD